MTIPLVTATIGIVEVRSDIVVARIEIVTKPFSFADVRVRDC